MNSRVDFPKYKEDAISAPICQSQEITDRENKFSGKDKEDAKDQELKEIDQKIRRLIVTGAFLFALNTIAEKFGKQAPAVFFSLYKKLKEKGSSELLDKALDTLGFEKKEDIRLHGTEEDACLHTVIEILNQAQTTELKTKQRSFEKKNQGQIAIERLFQKASKGQS